MDVMQLRCVMYAIYLLSFTPIAVKSYIWNFALSNPYSGHEFVDTSPSLRNTRNLQTNVNISTERQPCRHDKSCGTGLFCDRHYAVCSPLRRKDEACRRDSHCQPAYQCMYGRCREISLPPTIGARCKHDRDCGHIGCCARHHGEKVCKPLLHRGQRCYVPKGGLHYSLNELCPCASGLLCRKLKLKPNRKQHRFSSRYDSLRCASP